MPCASYLSLHATALTIVSILTELLSSLQVHFPKTGWLEKKKLTEPVNFLRVTLRSATEETWQVWPDVSACLHCAAPTKEHGQQSYMTSAPALLGELVVLLKTLRINFRILIKWRQTDFIYFVSIRIHQLSRKMSYLVEAGGQFYIVGHMTWIDVVSIWELLGIFFFVLLAKNKFNICAGLPQSGASPGCSGGRMQARSYMTNAREKKKVFIASHYDGRVPLRGTFRVLSADQGCCGSRWLLER